MYPHSSQSICKRPSGHAQSEVLALYLDNLGARMRDAKSLAAAQCKPLPSEEKVCLPYTPVQRSWRIPIGRRSGCQVLLWTDVRAIALDMVCGVCSSRMCYRVGITDKFMCDQMCNTAVEVSSHLLLRPTNLRFVSQIWPLRTFAVTAAYSRAWHVHMHRRTSWRGWWASCRRSTSTAQCRSSWRGTRSCTRAARTWCAQDPVSRISLQLRIRKT